MHSNGYPGERGAVGNRKGAALAFLSTLIALFMLTLLAGPALASEVGVEARDPATDAFYSEDNPYSQCPGPITARDVSVWVHNLGPDSDTYRLSLQLPQGWEGQIKPDVTLGSGERHRIPLLVINPPSPWVVRAGKYAATIKAQSTTNRNHVFTLALPIEMIACHELRAWFAESETAACEEDDPMELPFTIQNLGKWEEAVKATVKIGSFEATEEAVLAPGAEQDFTVTAPAARGKNAISLAVTSASSYARASASATHAVTSCSDFTAAMEPKKQDVCIDGTASGTLTLTNTGEDDAFALSAPAFVSLDETSVRLVSGESATIAFTATPPELGDVPFSISVTPSKAPQERQDLAGTLAVDACRSATLVVTDPAITIAACSGETITSKLLLTNTGGVKDTYALSASHGTLGLTSVTLEPGESQELELRAETAGMTGERTFSVVAEGASTRVEAGVQASLDLCYAAQLGINRNVTACPGTVATFLVTAENTGSKQDTYRLSLEGSTKQVVLAAHERQSFPFDVRVPADAAPGVRTVVAAVTSDRYSDERNASLTVPAYSSCYQALLADGRSKAVAITRAAAFRVRLENPGIAPQNFSLSIDGPSWIYPQPEDVSLAPKQAVDIYVYAVPPLGTPVSDHTATLIARSEQSRAELPLRIKVAAQINETTEPEEVSVPVTGQVVAVSSTQLVAAGAVALIAIFLLAFRFFVLGPRHRALPAPKLG